MGCVKLLFVISLLLLFFINYINVNGNITNNKEIKLRDYYIINNEDYTSSEDTSYIPVPKTTTDSSAGFKSKKVVNKWILEKNRGELDFKAELKNDRIEFVLSDFKVLQYDADNQILKVEIGKSNIRLLFSRKENKIITDIDVNGKKLLITSNLLDNGILTFSISKDGKITLNELAAVYPNTTVIIPSFGQLDIKKNTVQMSFDPSGLKKAVITLSFNTPVKMDEMSVTTMIIIFIVAVVIVVGLFGTFLICLFHPKCWLNNKFEEFLKRREEKKRNEQQTGQRRRKQNINDEAKSGFTNTETNARNVTTTETQLTNTNVKTEGNKSKQSKKKNRSRRNVDVPVAEPLRPVEPQSQEQQQQNRQLPANIYIKENINEQPRIPQVSQQLAVPQQEELYSAKDLTDDGGDWIEVKKKRRSKKSSSNNESRNNREHDPKGNNNKDVRRPVADESVKKGKTVTFKIDDKHAVAPSNSANKDASVRRQGSQIKAGEGSKKIKIDNPSSIEKKEPTNSVISNVKPEAENVTSAGEPVKASGKKNKVVRFVEPVKRESHGRSVKDETADGDRENLKKNNQHQLINEAVAVPSERTCQKPKKLNVGVVRKELKTVRFNFENNYPVDDPDVAGPSRTSENKNEKKDKTKTEKTYGSVGSQTLDEIAQQAFETEQRENAAQERQRQRLEPVKEEEEENKEKETKDDEE